MKKIVGIFVLLFCLNACDDGDFNIESFDFADAATNSCNNGESGFFIYKINDNEALILQIPEDSFKNEITPAETPRTIDINSINKVFYRLYNGTLSANVICNTIPPATPTVSNEWNALSGIIEISTFVNKQVNETTNASEITGYTHTIVLRNVNFDTGNGNQQLFTELAFGDYVTSSLRQGNFNVNIAKCGNNNSFLFKIPTIGTSTPANIPPQALTLSIDPSLFVPEVTPVNEPRTALLNGSSNLLKLIYYNGIISNEFLCLTEPPIFPSAIEEFISNNGVAGESGIIEVTTTIEYEIPTDNLSPIIGHRHKIALKNVTMTKSFPVLPIQVNFNFGNVYEFGEFVILL
ncbi:hypothetical protein M0M57_11525 [Flavobacterium azooxidireducens]|uniref:Lipoprotein n=1 Tax=Flavobacterium azooxidireducens TaxID=1871076 RepID=A0ABY4KEW2_9FLAO|nr:hypothetical protein [Flavobacterium azooxidireducens]UPQ78248.1 hypothetical protein M0M57_11525 [Flavobacterium azooxidireducens]